MKNKRKNQKRKGSTHDLSWGAPDVAPTDSVHSGRNELSRLEKRSEDSGQPRGQGRLVDKLVLRLPEFVSIGSRVPRVIESSILDDREPRCLDLLEVS